MTLPYQKTRGKLYIKITLYGTLCVLATYYIYAIMSVMLILVAPRSPASLPFSLLFAENIVYELETFSKGKGTFPRWWLVTAERLHYGNSGVLRELAQYYGAKHNLIKAHDMLTRILVLDPKNITNYKLYDKFWPDSIQRQQLSDRVLLLSKGYLTNDISSAVEVGLHRYPPRLSKNENAQELDYERINEKLMNISLAQLFYYFGLTLITDNPQGAAYWWNLAAITDMNLSFYSVDLAGLLSQKLQDVRGANAVLERCKANIYARAHCKLIQTESRNKIDLLPVAYYADYIQKQLSLFANTQ